MANRPPDDLKQAFLTLVDQARLDDWMRGQFPMGRWDRTLDTIKDVIELHVERKPVEASYFLMQLENKVLTAEINAMASDFSPGSVLAPARRQLGITSPADEKPFRIVVVDANHGDFRAPLHSHSHEAVERTNAWKVVSDFQADMAHAFAYVDQALEVPTIFLFHDTATRLIDGLGNKPMQFVDDLGRSYETGLTPIEVFLHELVHTQYSLKLQNTYEAPGRNINEIRANLKPGVRGYISDQQNMLGASLMTGGNLLRAIWQTKITDPPSKIYERMTRQMGASHTLLWSIMQPGGAAPHQDLWPWEATQGSGVKQVLDSLIYKEANKLGAEAFVQRFQGQIRRLPSSEAPMSLSETIGVQTLPVLETVFAETMSAQRPGLGL